MDPSRIVAEFPAPSFRGAQQQALADIRAAFEAGNDVVLVRAPTGSGKSLLARAIAGCARQDGEGPPGLATGAYYTTPQVSQLDDVAGDDLLDDLSVIRGKPNYSCILPGETTTPVNQAPCARERGFDCPVRHRCPYFADRATASENPIAAMTLAYFMQTAGSEVFGERDVVVVDEAHGLAEWAEMYATIELSPSTVPVWDACRPPDVDGIADVDGYAERLLDVCSRRQTELRGRAELTPDEAAERDRLAELRRDLQWFLDDRKDDDSPTVWVADQSDRGTRKDPRGGAVTVKPLDPARYLHHTVWDRGNRFALLSATILDKEAFCRGAGLNPDTVALVDVPHTFPVENRPLYDVTQGKMTYEHREETLPKLARTVVRLMAAHGDEKGLIHAHSYAIADQLRELLSEFGVGGRVRGHDRDNRDAALAGWKRSDDPDVFISVKMEEALDLNGDYCRWQVLCKAPYPNTNDSRVARRLEDGQWNWYYRTALRTVIQACGRVVRSPDDYGATYLADTSLLDLFERARGAMPSWFAEQVDRMSKPDLPSFDPEAALGDADSRSRTRRSQTGQSTGENGMDDHPLSDVWGDG
ncbi:helicase domain protein [Natronomonas pharaonis DSM 2160]|uniref:Helicase domain protein n=1 Tax=Natronomonas pharaonis (strain ATCC 35678 / DSM 2160 / CIP 103997 / JCM 8858 / NBRC 14720 / NCIMB 2260 / Gabara) TaxID=348780 RepID=A0A1U7EUB1_NATPD|nr:ATP-dependent DNA helicase [Natronomonas pharaonis]CAI48540.1 helicase domain protein [Natronomonas pharaonis DSM 2160]